MVLVSAYYQIEIFTAGSMDALREAMNAWLDTHPMMSQPIVRIMRLVRFASEDGSGDFAGYVLYEVYGSSNDD